jgi:hypothetical protein
MLYEQSVYTLMLLAALFEVVSIPLFLMLAKSLKSR